MKQQMKVRGRKNFKGRGFTPKIGQWYINKEELDSKLSKYVFAYKVIVITSIKPKARCTVQRITTSLTPYIETLADTQLLMLAAEVFKPVSEATIAAYLL